MENIYTKIKEVQQEVGKIVKDQDNPFFKKADGTKAKYFDINSLLEKVMPLLEKHNLVLIQPLTHIEGRPALKTILIDLDSEEQIESIVTLPDLQDAQKMGGCITYYRRYGLQSMFALQAEDDDGNKASGKTTNQRAL